MFLFTQDGFFRVGRRECDKNCVLVWSWTEKDAVRLIKKLGLVKETIFIDSSLFNMYCITVPIDLWKAYLVGAMDEITYRKLSSTPLFKRDKTRGQLLEDIVVKLILWQREVQKSAKRPPKVKALQPGILEQSERERGKKMIVFDDGTPVFSELCLFCKHFQGGSYKHWKCLAFPLGIPLLVWKGDVRHDKPLPGQKGEIVFERHDMPTQPGKRFRG